MTRTSFICLFLTLGVLSLFGCRSGPREDPILRYSAEEALQQGKDLMQREKYYRARRFLNHAFEVEPNSRGGREALLLAADAYYQQGGTDNFIKCEAKYRDFINRFPTSDRADYAQYQIANCLASRVEKPDRDQKVTEQALNAFQELQRLYPTSTYASEARIKVQELLNRLAAHELVIARFYMTYGGGGLCIAAIKRLEPLETEYPEFELMDEVFFQLARAYHKCKRIEEAEASYEKLRESYPSSSYLAELEKNRKKW